MGGAGNDILIGGAGGDALVGNGGSDLLIGGTTSWSGNLVALMAIQNEWTQATAYDTRVGHLRGTLSGGLNGSFFLNSTTVANVGANGALIGGPGKDWFWASVLETTDIEPGESLN